MEIDIAGIGLRLATLVLLAIYLYLTVRALLVEFRRDDDPVWRRTLWVICLLAFPLAGLAAWYLNEWLTTRGHRSVNVR